jgi:hypothetical protein
MNLDHQWIGQVYTTGKHRVGADVTALSRDTYTNTLILLSIVGASTVVDAIRANVSMGRNLDFKERITPTMLSYSGISLKTKDQKYRVVKSRLSTVGLDHYIILNERLVEPKNATDWTATFVGEDVGADIHRRLSDTLELPVLPSWGDYLFSEGINRKLIRQVWTKGARLVVIQLKDDWNSIISNGLKEGYITWEEVNDGTA